MPHAMMPLGAAATLYFEAPDVLLALLPLMPPACRARQPRAFTFIFTPRLLRFTLSVTRILIAAACRCHAFSRHYACHDATSLSPSRHRFDFDDTSFVVYACRRACAAAYMRVRSDDMPAQPRRYDMLAALPPRMLRVIDERPRQRMMPRSRARCGARQQRSAAVRQTEGTQMRVCCRADVAVVAASVQVRAVVGYQRASGA